MLFLGVRYDVADAVPAADPRVAPGAVLNKHIAPCPPTNNGSDRQPERLLLSTEGTPGDTITVELYAEREGPVVVADTDPGGAAARAARRFYRFASGIVLTVGEMTVLPGINPAVPGVVATILGVAGTFPTTFAGGETLDLEIDGQVVNVVFAVGDQSNVQVAAAINVAAAAAGVPGTPASVVTGEIQIAGAVASSAGEVVVTGGTGAATLGLTGLSAIGTDPVPASEIAGAVPPGGRIYVRATARTAARAQEVLVACVD